MDDAPGLGLIGLSIAFDGGLIKKDFISAVFLLCFGVGTIFVLV